MLALAAVGCAGGKKTVTETEPKTESPAAPKKDMSYELQFKTPPHATAAYVLSVHSRFAQEIMGKETVADAGWRAVVRQSAASPGDGGTLRVAFDFDSLKIQTRDPAVEPLLKPLEGVIGKSVQAVITSIGEVRSLQGLEKLPAAANQNNQMESSLRSFFPRFAGFPTKVGESWSRQDTTLNKNEVTDLKIVNRSRYSLLSAIPTAKTTQLKLHNSSSFSLSGLAKNQGMDIGLSGAGTTEADFIVDYTDGWLISATATTNSSGTAKFNTPQPTSIPWRSTITVSISRK
jgi:hypothetical protein